MTIPARTSIRPAHLSSQHHYTLYIYHTRACARERFCPNGWLDWILLPIFALPTDAHKAPKDGFHPIKLKHS